MGMEHGTDGGDMKYFVVALVLVMTGCVKEVPLTEKQKLMIEQHINIYGATVNVEGQTDVVNDVVALPGESKYAACSACHGVNGGGGMGPALAGKDIEYVVGRLTAYKNGEKVGGQSNLMWGVAGGLSVNDMEDLAEYVTQL